MAAGTHVVLSGSKRQKDSAAVRVGDVDPKAKMTVTIGLAGPKLPGPAEYVGQTLSPRLFSKKFGALKADAAKVAGSLKKYGLRVLEVSLPTRSLRMGGTCAAMEAAFKAGLGIFRSSRQGDYRGRHGTIKIPKEVRGIVTGVFGLDQRQMVRRKASGAGTPKPAAVGTPLGPAEIERHYHFPPGDGSGQHIAIAEFGGGYFKDDMAAYARRFRRPMPTVRTIALAAQALTLRQILALAPPEQAAQLDISAEVMMDVEILGGLCPKANLSVYFSTSDQAGLIDLLDQVIRARPVALSISWGLAEDDPSWSANAITAINDRLNAARLLGITVCVSSGDDGSGDQIDDGQAHVNFPSSSPHVLGVGGTMLAASKAGAKEVAWWNSPGRLLPNGGGGAGGGGVSAVFPRPAWQDVSVASLNSGSIDGRVVPDVAAIAGAPSYTVLFRGNLHANGGTSASTPVWAALIARINACLPPAKRQRFLTPLLYKPGLGGQPVGQASLSDITEGDNASYPQPGKGYSALPGYDAVSGWGVPNGGRLLRALTAV